MKRILLASTAIVAFAGAAHADGHLGIGWAGDAEFGWNDDVDDGIFWALGLTVTGTAELDNGYSASISGDVELVNSPEFDDGDDSILIANGGSAFDGNEVEIDDLVISIFNDTSSLRFGDTAPAADAIWSSPVTNLDADGFNDEDDLENEDAILIGRATFGEVEVGVSYGVVDSNGDDENTLNDGSDDDLLGLQVGAAATLGAVDLVFGYQEEIDGQSTEIVDIDFANTPEIWSIGGSTTLAGAEVGAAYATAEGSSGAGVDSLGLQAAFSFGDITTTVFYVFQDGENADGSDADIDDNYGFAVDYAAGALTVGFLYHDGSDEDIQLNLAYDLGNGLSLFGGYRDEGENILDQEQAEIYYVGADYDLGGGATIRASYADVSEGEGGVASTLDELGAAEDVKEGATLQISFTF
ncbi:MAG: porin [Pseudomonadota bacterium]